MAFLSVTLHKGQLVADRILRYAQIAGRENIIAGTDRKSTRLNSSHSQMSYAVFCLKKKIRIKDDKGRTDYIKDEEGKVVKSRLNQKLLPDITHATEARYDSRLHGAKAIRTPHQQVL